MTEDRFTLDDVIRAGGCPSGIRRWFTSRGDDLPTGVTLRSFIDNGMTLAQARECQDGFVDRALRLKEARHGQ